MSANSCVLSQDMGMVQPTASTSNVLAVLDGLMAKELKAFNEPMTQRNVPNVVTRPRAISD